MVNYVNKYREIVEKLIKESFPSLRNERIKVKGYPKWLFFWVTGFVYQGINSYYICISSCMKDLSDKGKRGVMAHELGHLEDFKKKDYSFFYMVFREIFVWLSWAFDSSKSREIERETDIKTIKKRYGKELLYYRYWLERKYGIKIMERRYSRGYLSPKEIKNFMRKYKR